MKPLQVGLIGCGTIGRALAEFLLREFPRQARLAYVCEHRAEKVQALSRKFKIKPRLTHLHELIRRSDFVIEAASARVAGEAAALTLRRHKQILVMSAGGLIGNRAWMKALARTQGRLWVPSGAVAGLDGLLAARESGLKRVRLITRKPPQALESAGYFLKHRFPKLRGNQEVRVYAGPALRAVADFPQNVNVAAVLSLAGLGPRKTRVEIWTSKRYKENTHEILIESKSGEIRILLKNVPSTMNPKTSALAFYSAMALMRRIFSNFQIGT